MCRRELFACKCLRHKRLWMRTSSEPWGFLHPVNIWNSAAQTGAACTVLQSWIFSPHASSFLPLQQMNVVHHMVQLQFASYRCCDVSADWSKGIAGMDWGGSQALVLHSEVGWVPLRGQKRERRGGAKGGVWHCLHSHHAIPVLSHLAQAGQLIQRCNLELKI